MIKKLLSFFGVATSEAGHEDLSVGKRRFIAYLSALTFALLVASSVSDAWVKGGLEFTLASPLAEAPCVGCGSPLQGQAALGATFKATFKLGLQSVAIAQEYTFPYSGAPASRVCSYDTASYIQEVNAAAASNDSSPRNIFYGLAPIPYSTFSATSGLVAFAAVLQFAAWLLLIWVQYDGPICGSHPKVLLAIRLLLLSMLFFTILSVAVFGASPAMSEFCKAFDPDAAFNGLPCGFSAGFSLGVAALVLSLINCLASWLYMPSELGPRYSFKAASSGSGFEPASGGSYNSGGFSSNAYQDIGPTATA